MSGKNPTTLWGVCIAVLVTLLCDRAVADVFDMGPGLQSIEFVSVGNPGNAPDPVNEGAVPGIGSVSYEYNIARHEVTNAQYAEFLTTVASTDTNGLYNVNMDTQPSGGIMRSGSPGSFTYTVKQNMHNKPVVYVSFFDAMRFINWLHNGQPIGMQDLSTTEDGVYAISNGLSETRALGALYFLPSESEWYKAAYHQPAGQGGDNDDYWLYPTRSNSVPAVAIATATGDISNPGANVANHSFGADWNSSDGNVTTVGSAGPLSESYYGTSDQRGNAWEWNEAVDISRGNRAGSFQNGEDRMRSTFRGSSGPAAEDRDIGFRVGAPINAADVPAANGVAILVLAILLVLSGTVVVRRQAQ